MIIYLLMYNYISYSSDNLVGFGAPYVWWISNVRRDFVFRTETLLHIDSSSLLSLVVQFLLFIKESYLSRI